MPLPIPAPREQGYTTTTDVPLYWCRYGPEGADRLLVLHGGPGAHHDYMLPQFLALAGTHELVFYDQRGGGRSRTLDDVPVSWEMLAQDVLMVARELRFQHLSLVGYSWGALLSVLYALHTAERGRDVPLRRMVLIDPAPLSRRYRALFEAEFSRRQSSFSIRELRERLARSGLRESAPDDYRRQQFELSVVPYFADPGATSQVTSFRVTDRVQRSVWESLGDYDLLPQLESLRVPSFFVHGRLDPIPLESSELGARAMGARLLVLEASGHVPYVEQPAALFGAIEQFLEDTASHG